MLVYPYELNGPQLYQDHPAGQGSSARGYDVAKLCCTFSPDLKQGKNNKWCMLRLRCLLTIMFILFYFFFCLLFHVDRPSCCPGQAMRKMHPWGDQLCPLKVWMIHEATSHHCTSPLHRGWGVKVRFKRIKENSILSFLCGNVPVHKLNFVNLARCC